MDWIIRNCPPSWFRFITGIKIFGWHLAACKTLEWDAEGGWAVLKKSGPFYLTVTRERFNYISKHVSEDPCQATQA